MDHEQKAIQAPAKKAKPAKRNRGWFRRGDTRINQLGRALRRVPTLTEKVKKWDGQAACPVCERKPSPKSGQVMQLSLSERELRGRLTLVTFDCAYELT